MSISPEDYFKLRMDSEGLKAAGRRFEGVPWGLIREADDGWIMKVYRIEGDVEVCIISPDGTSCTFS
jgi:hypothetical protein